jgi:hypothetical protein
MMSSLTVEYERSSLASHVLKALTHSREMHRTKMFIFRK